MILPTGQWGTPHYSQPATEEWLHLITLCGTWNTLNIENHAWGPWCVISGQIIVSSYMHYVWYSQPATEERQLYGAIGHIKHWKPCLGALMCYFVRTDPFLIYAWFVILPTGQWGTPHYYQLVTEEWMHLTALWSTWNTSNIENHLGGLDV